MMEILEVDRVSREMIRPSHSTPDHLRSFKFSHIEQFMHFFYIPVIHFYPIKDGQQMLPRLKESLSQTLTKFYPLAGRIIDNVSVDCNDEGVTCVEARANCRMLDFLKDPRTELLEHFFPCKRLILGKPISQLCPVELQVTVFECGALAIGGCFSHKMMDATSISCFLHSWAANTSCLYEHQTVSPDFTAASSRFPPATHFTQGPCLSQVEDDKRKLVLKRFVFDARAITSIKAKATSSRVPNPTTVEVVFGFIWKHAMAALTRSRSAPPMPKNIMGCVVLMRCIHCSDKEAAEEEELHGRDRGNFFMCTSWCKLGMSEVDFGWGKPIWVCLWGEPPAPDQRNVFKLKEIEGGKGIEAWLVLDEQEMATLEGNQDFLEFAIPVVGVYQSTSSTN
ncbi:hypothetical protein Ancab_010190 [Ancistrocladus abbreviatus]